MNVAAKIPHSEQVSTTSGLFRCAWKQITELQHLTSFCVFVKVGVSSEMIDPVSRLMIHEKTGRFELVKPLTSLKLRMRFKSTSDKTKRPFLL